MEKREHTRYLVWFPVTVELNATPVFAVCVDASKGGILISGASRLEIGAEVSVKFRIGPSLPEQMVMGRIVRIEAGSDDPRAVWRYRMAIEFATSVPELEGQLRRASENPPPL